MTFFQQAEHSKLGSMIKHRRCYSSSLLPREPERVEEKADSAKMGLFQGEKDFQHSNITSLKEKISLVKAYPARPTVMIRTQLGSQLPGLGLLNESCHLYRFPLITVSKWSAVQAIQARHCHYVDVLCH